MANAMEAPAQHMTRKVFDTSLALLLGFAIPMRQRLVIQPVDSPGKNEWDITMVDPRTDTLTVQRWVVDQ